MKVKGQQKIKREVDLDLEVSAKTIERMGAPLGVQPGQDNRPAARGDHGAVVVQEEVAAQREDRSISVYGRVSRPPS